MDIASVCFNHSVVVWQFEKTPLIIVMLRIKNESTQIVNVNKASMVFIHNGILGRYKEWWNYTIHYNLDRIEEYYVKWRKFLRRKKFHAFSYPF